MAAEDRRQWALDNIYTLARREVTRRTTAHDGRVNAAGLGQWAHVLRLCEDVGCRARGVLRDADGSEDGIA